MYVGRKANNLREKNTIDLVFTKANESFAHTPWKMEHMPLLFSD